jgi:transcriptional regulator with XRE-family HTH domain
MRDDLSRYLKVQLCDPDVAAAYADDRALLELLESLVVRRRELGLSQRAVAKAMGTTQSAVSELERAEADPRISTLQRYARAVGMQVILQARAPQAIVPTITVDVSPRPNSEQTGRASADAAWSAASVGDTAPTSSHAADSSLALAA